MPETEEVQNNGPAKETTDDVKQGLSELLKGFSAAASHAEGAEQSSEEEEETLNTTVEGEEKEEKEEQVEQEEEKVEGEEEEESSEPSLMTTINALKEEIAELKGTMAKRDHEEEGEEELETFAPTPVEMLEGLVSDEEYDEVLTSKDALVKLLTKLYNKIREDTMRDVPRIAEMTNQRQATAQVESNKFWSNNRDLLEHQDFVVYTANKVAQELPRADLSTVFSETEKRVRKALGVQKKVVKKEEERKKKDDPFPPKQKRKTRNTGGDDRSEAQKSLDEVLGITS